MEYGPEDEPSFTDLPTDEPDFGDADGDSDGEDENV